jgi:adenylate kinase
MRVYKEQAEKIRSYYQAKKVYHRIDGSGTIEEIFNRLVSVLDAALAKTEAGKAFG